MEQFSTKKISLFEFNNLNTKDDMKYELIDGIVLMSPRPNYKHQEIMSKLLIELGNYLKGKSCKVFTEAELEFNNDVLIPDLSVICGLDNTEIQRYKKAPDIVIEIISPSSRYTDTFTKLIKYELFKVNEYCIVDPQNEFVTIYDFKYKTVNNFSKQEKLISAVFDNLEIDLSYIFQ